VELEFADVEPSLLESKKQEARSKHPIENLSEVSSQKSKKILFGMSSPEQTPRFATNKHFVAMNP
jgi:hypothetical protein